MIKDFLIKLLGGYRIIVGYFDVGRETFIGRQIKMYPFRESVLKLKQCSIFFDKNGKISIKPNINYKNKLPKF